jgi:hypothetical protein
VWSLHVPCVAVCCWSVSAARLNDVEADAAVALAFVARVLFGLALTSLLLSLTVTISSTLHARVYPLRFVAPELAMLASTL